jgi:signal transduction histidine kinase
VGSQPSPTLGYQSKLVNLNRDPNPVPRWVQIDLGTAVPVREVRVFPAHPPEFAHRPGFGFPLEWKVELSNEQDFREAVALRDFDEDVPFGLRMPVSPGDNVATFFARGETARYVRFTALQLFNANGQYNLALAEMQVWSGDANVAIGKTVSAFDSLEAKGWSQAALIDGFNSEANILDWPEWLAGLSLRRETEQRLASLEARQLVVVHRLQHLGWWLLAGAVAAVLIVLLASMLRQRHARRAEMEALRQRIARDLHDEIGSSLGSIALISQDVMAVADDPAQVRRELTEIQGIARQTVDSMRDIARLVQSETYGQGDLSAHLREIANRMLRNIPHTLQLAEGDIARHIAVDRQRDLVLIFKETLHNILKHAHATQVEVVLIHERGHLKLAVQDNGRGFDPAAPASSGMGLANLRRRAEKHGGEVLIASTLGAGSTVTILLPAHA